MQVRYGWCQYMQHDSSKYGVAVTLTVVTPTTTLCTRPAYWSPLVHTELGGRRHKYNIDQSLLVYLREDIVTRAAVVDTCVAIIDTPPPLLLLLHTATKTLQLLLPPPRLLLQLHNSYYYHYYYYYQHHVYYYLHSGYIART